MKRLLDGILSWIALPFAAWAVLREERAQLRALAEDAGVAPAEYERRQAEIERRICGGGAR